MSCRRRYEQFTSVLETEYSHFWDIKCGFFSKPGIEMAAVTVKCESTQNLFILQHPYQVVCRWQENCCAPLAAGSAWLPLELRGQIKASIDLAEYKVVKSHGPNWIGQTLWLWWKAVIQHSVFGVQLQAKNLPLEKRQIRVRWQGSCSRKNTCQVNSRFCLGWNDATCFGESHEPGKPLKSSLGKGLEKN